MADFKIVEGRQSSLYNHFSEYELISCRATETRLMGVLALKLTWQDESDAKKKYYQIMHLDYSEYGIDEYLEFECLPGSEDYSYLKSEVQERWNRFIRVTGGAAVSISPSCMLRLLDSALSLAGDDRDREYDDEENIRFRQFALRRLGMMKDVLAKRNIRAEDCPLTDAIDAVSVSGLGQYGTINYFLMRLLDRDFDAASYLSDIPREELEGSLLAAHGVQSLIRSSISIVPRTEDPRIADRLRMYNCRITSLSRNGYYHTSLSIWLDGARGSKDAMVKGLEVGSETLLSDYEAAVQVSQGEYLTIFDFKSDSITEFNPSYIEIMAASDETLCENGILYTIYNETNNHVERAEYRLSDDVYGYALLSLRNELILMSTEFSRITSMDESVILSVYSPFVSIKARYRVEHPLFHTLCHTPGLSSEDFIETDE